MSAKPTDKGLARVSAPLATVMASGEMSPAFIYHDSIYGSEGWDTRMSEVVPGVG